MRMARTWWTGALLALALGGCEEQPRETAWGPIPPAQNGEKAPEAVDTAFMQGEWTLDTLGAWPPQSGTPAITLNITADRIEAQSQCKRFAWTYKMTTERLTVTTAPDGEPECDRKLSIWEMAFEEAVTRANTAELSADGGLALRGAGGELTLKGR